MIFYLAMGLGIAFFLMFILFSIGALGKATIWHGFAFFMLAVFIAVMVSFVTNLFSWILLGISFSSWGATLFVLGLLSMLIGALASYIKIGHLVS